MPPSRSATPISATGPGAPPVLASSREPDAPELDPADVPAAPDAPRLGVWLRPFLLPLPFFEFGLWDFFVDDPEVCDEPNGSWYCWSPAPLSSWAGAAAGTAPTASDAAATSTTRRRAGGMKREAY